MCYDEEGGAILHGVEDQLSVKDTDLLMLCVDG